MFRFQRHSTKAEKCLKKSFVVDYVTDNLDGAVREDSQSEDESSSSSDEMLFDPHPRKPLHSSRERLSTSEEPSLTSYTGRVSDVSVPGSDILENIDTPPPFRKRTLQMTQDDKERRPSNVSLTPSSPREVNGQLCKY